VVDQQLQLAQPRLLGAGRVERRLPQRSPGDGERIDQVRLAPQSTTTPLRCRHPWRHPHQPLPPTLQRPLQPTGHMPTVLQRPQPAPANPLRPRQQLAGIARLERIELPANLIDGNSRQRVLVHVHPDHDHQ
jgi:hypothetical protein